MHVGRRAERHDPAKDRRAGEPPVSQQLDDSLVGRLSLELFPLADVNAHEYALTLESVHGGFLGRIHQSAPVRPARLIEMNRPAMPMPTAQARRARTTLETT